MVDTNLPIGGGRLFAEVFGIEPENGGNTEIRADIVDEVPGLK